jgi:anti-sigma regulatory factor (Ser/Thr protein kinase)
MHFSRPAANIWEGIIPTEKVLHERVAALLIEAIQPFLNLTEDLRFKVELCLQEGLQNAAVHGNLAVTMPLLSVDDFENAQALIAQHLTESPFKQRQVRVVCKVLDDILQWDIQDEGNGFSLEDTQKATLFGRGFMLIAELSDAFSYCQETKTLQLLFKQSS